MALVSICSPHCSQKLQIICMYIKIIIYVTSTHVYYIYVATHVHIPSTLLVP